MSEHNESFQAGPGLNHALNFLRKNPASQQRLPNELSDRGIGEHATLDLLAPHVFECAARLDSPETFAHMDPPTPWITWATTLWNARLNQNLLHRATGPFAIEAEDKVLDWLTPFFGMSGGHMCSGSTIANLTSLWAARDSRGIRKIIASKSAHISIAKAAMILGLPYEQIETNSSGQIDQDKIGELSDACLVLTAGTTDTGTIDSLALAGEAKWTHIDAAWAGPLRLSQTHSHLLDGVNKADSIAVSAHKWLFQPKDSALVMFRDNDLAKSAISFGSGYLADPNVGVQGSRGASAIPLLATLIAWGREGIADRLNDAMSMAQLLATELSKEPNICLWAMPETGVTVFRPVNMSVEEFQQCLPGGMFSSCILNGEKWVRSVAANPMADIDKILEYVRHAAR